MTNPNTLRELLARATPFLRDEAAKYDDDGSNEPLELAREIEEALATPQPAPVVGNEPNGWDAVQHALDAADPTWRRGGGPLRGLAVESIRRLAAQPASDRLAQLEDQAEKARALEWLLQQRLIELERLRALAKPLVDQLAVIYKDPSHD